MQARIQAAEALLGWLEGYLGIGLVLAVLFALFGVGRIDGGARFDKGAPIGSVLFRLMIVPATTLLWPVVIVRAVLLARRAPEREERAPGAES